jgi:hypothetical protein
MMKPFRLFLILMLLTIVGTTGAWAVEVSESLTKIQRIGSAVVYTFNYPSKDVAGEDIVLSSMLMAWQPKTTTAADSIETVHIYSHFTVTDDKGRPSSTESKEQLILPSFCRDKYLLLSSSEVDYATRCIIIAPDYEGYGVTRNRMHPYLAQNVTAKQEIDGVIYGLQLYQKLVEENKALPIKSNWRSFGLGFSQGGAVTLAVQRFIEQHELAEELHFRGSICGDGSYDLIATLRYYMYDDGNSYGQNTPHRKGTSPMPMVLPMIFESMLISHPDMKGHELEDYFSQQFLDTGIMDWLNSKDYTTKDIHKMWYKQLNEGLEANGRSYTKEQMAELFSASSSGDKQVIAHLDKLFTPELYKYLADSTNLSCLPIEKGDACKDLHRALVDNNVTTGWEPQHRIQFVHAKGDMVVPYGNYLAFRDAHSSGENTMYRVYDKIDTYDHVSAGSWFFLNLIIPLSNFDQFYSWIDEESTVTGIDEVRSRGVRSEMYDDVWYDLQGRRLSSEPTRAGIYINKGIKVVIK